MPGLFHILIFFHVSVALFPGICRAEPHWSLLGPARPSLSNGAGDAIDALVDERLAEHKVKPAPRASRHTLIRRLSWDLRGLPPTPAEVEAFEHDERPDAWLRLVDRFLGSPHFGERMAQNWFDLARFSDTSGYAADRTRNVWPYRDWVIDAVNRNMPFNQFTIEQLAGDLLPDATQEQQVATGFLRQAMQAKGNNPRKEEFRIKTIVDRLETTGRTWLGLSLECAECHDHKYDPISQREYYQLFAIFNNVPHLGSGYNTHGPRMTYLQPDGFYEERGQNEPGNSNFTWKPSQGKDRHRKSIYIYWKRMGLHPSLATLDAPPRQVCVARRSVTNTPQQALVTLNDPMFDECARAFAKRVIGSKKARTEEERIRRAFRLCLSRDPDRGEMRMFLEFLKTESWYAAAAVLLNLDEALTRE